MALRGLDSFGSLTAFLFATISFLLWNFTQTLHLFVILSWWFCKNRWLCLYSSNPHR